LGRHVEARDAFDRLLRAHPDADAALLGEARQLRGESVERVAALVLLGLPTAEVRLRLDGSDLEDAGTRPLRVEADPGTHALRVDFNGMRPFLWEGVLTDGSEQRIEVELLSLAGRERVAIDESSVFEEPLFWIAVGVAVAGGAVGAALLLSGADDASGP